MSPIRSLLVLAAAALPAACTHDSFTPNINSVVGDYHLQSLTTTDLGGPRDWVALGATLTLSLAPNGTTSGRLFMPGGGLGGRESVRVAPSATQSRGPPRSVVVSDCK